MSEDRPYIPQPCSLIEALLDILAHVDYTGYGGCKPNETLVAVLPEGVLKRSHEAIDHYRKKNNLHTIFGCDGGRE